MSILPLRYALPVAVSALVFPAASLQANAIAPGTPDAAEPADASETPISEPTARRVHLTLDLNFTSAYYFRGIPQEDDGFIFQPSAELAFDLHESDDWSLSAYAGVWNSFHDRNTGAADPDDSLAAWYEIDFYAGVSLTSGRLSTDLGFTRYASPNDAFEDVDEFILTLAWDDTGWIDDLTIAPYATLALEADGQGDGGENEGLFLALGIEPSHTYGSTGIGALTVSLPVEAGFSLDDYYEGAGGDDAFGYLTIGLAGSVGLPSPEGFGAWSFNAGVDFLLLGDTAEALNNGDDAEWIVHSGVTFEF